MIARRFGLTGHEAQTLEQVGHALGLTRERMRKIKIDPLRNRRNAMVRALRARGPAGLGPGCLFRLALGLTQAGRREGGLGGVASEGQAARDVAQAGLAQRPVHRRMHATQNHADTLVVQALKR